MATDGKGCFSVSWGLHAICAEFYAMETPVGQRILKKSNLQYFPVNVKQKFRIYYEQTRYALPPSSRKRSFSVHFRRQRENPIDQIADYDAVGDSEAH